MDRAFWRIEARRVRAEGQHLINLADDIETAAREAPPGWHEPAESQASASRTARILVALLGAAAAVILLIFALSRPAYPASACNASLWQHVYRGRFASAHDRLRVIKPCITVTGTIEHAAAEPDGDWHIRVRLDPKYAGLLDARNRTAQHGDLVLEPICSNHVRQHDTLEQRSCAGFHQDVFNRRMIGKHVAVTGAYVRDMDHGWNEIHPVTSIVVLPN